jgi:hypothetical protein
MDVFGDTFIPSGLGDAWFATRGCPDCLDRPLEQVRSLDESHWLCATCGQCWRVEHGLLRSADPLTCRGCTGRRKSDCVAMWRSTFPQFDTSSK